jgi:hypothetical protein
MPVQENLAIYLGQVDVTPEQRARAVRLVAAAAEDPAECRMLLDMLGLEPPDASR